LFQKIRELSKHLAIYGSGDVAIQALNFLLLPLYVKYLTKADYGVLALLASVEATVKLFFRWGVDGAFMRFWYDCEDQRARQRLASTLFFFLLAANGVLLVLSLIASPFISERLLQSAGNTLALQLVLLNTFAIGFTFIPFHVLRIEGRAREFSGLTLARSASTLVLRLVLVIGAGLGVMGVVLADVIVTSVLLVIMLRWFAPLLRPMFARDVLRQSLAFGLPRIPHGFAMQLMAVGDRFVMTRYVSVQEIGVYSMGVSFGLIEKIVLAAVFEHLEFLLDASRRAFDLEIDDGGGRDGFAFEHDDIDAGAVEELHGGGGFAAVAEAEDIAVEALGFIEVGAAQADLVDGGKSEGIGGLHGHGLSSG